jgi:YHS domain-containing protein
MTRDPVCKMDLNEKDAVATTSYKGDVFYFCSQDCKQRFDADPEQYVSRSEHSQT